MALTTTTYVQGGVNSIQINGVSYTCMQQMTYNITTEKQEWVPNWQGVVPIVVTPQLCTGSAKILWDQTYNIGDFNGLSGATIVLLLANGHLLSFNSCFIPEVGEVDAKDNSFTISWQAGSVGIV